MSRRKKDDGTQAVATSFMAIAMIVVAIITVIGIVSKILWIPISKKGIGSKLLGAIGIFLIWIGILFPFYKSTIKTEDNIIKEYYSGKVVEINSVKGANIRKNGSVNNSNILFVGKLASAYKYEDSLGNWYKITFMKDDSLQIGFISKTVTKLKDGNLPIYSTSPEKSKILYKSYSGFWIVGLILYVLVIIPKFNKTNTVSDSEREMNQPVNSSS